MALEDDQEMPSSVAPLSVEERLRHVRECCRLLADLFEIQAEATFLGASASMSMDAYNALMAVSRGCADDLARLIGEIPTSLANWRESTTSHV